MTIRHRLKRRQHASITLLKEIAQAEERLRAADFDPEIIRTLRYQIEKVTEAGGVPDKKESVLGKLERYKSETEEQKRQGTERKKPTLE